MRKLSLDLDALTVDSFAPADTSGGGAGTVAAHEATQGHSCFETDCCLATRATCTC